MSQQTENENPIRKSTGAVSPTLNSSPRPSSSINSKERRHPSITPRKFRRFFTPRQPLSDTDSLRSASLKLRALSTQRKVLSSPIDSASWSDENSPPTLPRGSKRQKLSHNISSNPQESVFDPESKGPNSNSLQRLETRNEQKDDPVPSSPCPRDRRIVSARSVSPNYNGLEDDEETSSPVEKASLGPIKRLNRCGGLSMQLYEMELGLRRPGRLHHRYPVNGMCTVFLNQEVTDHRRLA